MILLSLFLGGISINSYFIFQGCDLINANWIGGFNGPNEFIATQDPSATTAPSFWQMILENNVQLIVMFTELSEVSHAGGLRHQFWLQLPSEI